MSDLVPTSSTPPASAFPATTSAFTSFTIDCRIGPHGFQYLATRDRAIVLAVSDWDRDAGIAWADLTAKLAPMILRTANRAIS
ncbi:hypothetical protein [Actinoplanes sp. NBRC 101535]|uniref:hypothetical protein n=1 Tax=Actinoplanes sp. NBRC 101535 TaxID=3032196 RepID=UPI0024A0F87D|nr:hypothetical protein [Actinoplanes sp. NBRC 101535]GLY08251.1 hypothetical protein Acsp01_86300 [Actinoplanes sp. NBRC 101535]